MSKYELFIKKSDFEMTLCADKDLIVKQFEESVQELTTVVVKQKPLDPFKAFMNSKDFKNQTDKLIAVAYYLRTHENKNSFSVKNINAKIYECLNEIIDHKVVDLALEHNYLVALEGERGKEYALTFLGEDYFENKI